MTLLASQRPQGVRVFENDFLESLTHVHPAIPIVIWGPVATAALWHSVSVLGAPGAQLPAIALAAVLGWTLLEYTLHRFLFHFPAKSKLGRRLVFLVHGLHHDDPDEPTRLVMPPSFSIPLGIAVYFSMRALFGAATGEAAFAFFVTSYLFYDYTHYGVHHFQQRTPIGRALKRHHMLHHYADPMTRFGVSSPLWDEIFGTLHSKQPKRAARG